MQPQLPAHRHVLPLGHHPVRAVHVAAHGVLEKIVAVEAAAALPELGDPRPDVVRPAVHGDRPCRREISSAEEVITRQRRGNLVVGRAPPELPGTQREPVDGEARYAECRQPTGRRAEPGAHHSPILLMF